MQHVHSRKHILNLIGSTKLVQQAIYNITLHLYSDDIKYKISKKIYPNEQINVASIFFLENSYKELHESYMKKDNDKWNVLINNCNYISCLEICDLNKYIHQMSNGEIINHNLFVYQDKSENTKITCLKNDMICDCKQVHKLNMEQYYLSEKHETTKQFLQGLINYKKYEYKSMVNQIDILSKDFSSKNNVIIQPDI